MSTNTTIPMQRLLQHRQWVRNLARKLVLDEARADDLEQQTWLAAIERPPTSDTPKAWLGTVMRNLAARMRRSEYRVDRREGVAARPERLPATGDVVAQAELHKQVVQAVLDLDEPYRETVLLRHYEGLAPRHVAARMGVPVETVRSRTRRGLQQVRSRLDARHGGDGHAWKLALLPLARLADGVGVGAGGAAAATATATAPGAGATTTGALLMSAQSKLAAAALALLLLGGGAWFLLDDDDAYEAPPAPIESGEAAKADAGPMLEARGAAKAETTAP
ncbi:MAG: sigma-70 family RNA polymerase sigma factor, partial [Planctomycetota bacterium]|nr:sigma-70 family RNA polymerase sigma factor [Planctomycetota bacterium]